MNEDPTPTGAEPAPDPHAWREACAEGHFERAQRDRLLLVQAGKIAEDPEVGRALAVLADVQALVRGKAWAKAQRRLGELEARPELIDWEALERELDQLRRGSEAIERRDPDTALAVLDEGEAQLLAAEHATQRGTALILDARPEEAAPAFEEALERDPKHHRALTNLGNVALEEERVDDAIDYYQQALRLDEDFPNAHHNLGVAYRRKGQIGKSVASLRRAQRATRRADTQRARESLKTSRPVMGPRTRWLLWGAGAAAVVWFLMSRGGP